MNTILHKIGTHRSPHLSQLISELGWEGYGLYIAICDTLAEQPDGKYPTARLGALAFSLHADETKVKGVICDYGLFVTEDPPENPSQPSLFPSQQVFYSPEIMENIQRANYLRDKRSKAASSRWKDPKEMQMQSKPDANAMHMESKCNASAMQVHSKCNADAMQVESNSNASASQKEKENTPLDKEKENFPPHPPIREKEILPPLEKKENAYQRGEKFPFGKISPSARAREIGIPIPEDPSEKDLEEAIHLIESRLQENLPAEIHNEVIDLKELILKEKEKICAEKEKENQPPVTSLQHQMRLAFEKHYKQETNLLYYFTAKDATALKSITAKIRFQLQAQGLEITDTQIMESWIMVLRGIQDPWIRSNMTPAIINSKWNEILQQLSKPSSNGRDKQITDDYRRDIARRLAL